MTSLFDQYEQESQRSRPPVPSSVPDMGVGMGYIDLNVEDDVPIFAKQTVNFKPTHRVTHLAVNNESALQPVVGPGLHNHASPPVSVCHSHPPSSLPHHSQVLHHIVQPPFPWPALFPPGK
ncbi:hypothetical protein LSTR_LSTR014029 [Laodelphax striatellus]|uniref:Uncharacterized protein n=1 Tax=Laodelphax striatellus TaxID=195883 RepID=A0A482WI85_LAOST|nr:hypothetical protein LSTR_LSTR014029 [Laodelphax striatellus]